MKTTVRTLAAALALALTSATQNARAQSPLPIPAPATPTPSALPTPDAGWRGEWAPRGATASPTVSPTEIVTTMTVTATATPTAGVDCGAECFPELAAIPSSVSLQLTRGSSTSVLVQLLSASNPESCTSPECLDDSEFEFRFEYDSSVVTIAPPIASGSTVATLPPSMSVRGFRPGQTLITITQIRKRTGEEGTPLDIPVQAVELAATNSPTASCTPCPSPSPGGPPYYRLETAVTIPLGTTRTFYYDSACSHYLGCCNPNLLHDAQAFTWDADILENLDGLTPGQIVLRREFLFRAISTGTTTLRHGGAGNDVVVTVPAAERGSTPTTTPTATPECTPEPCLRIADFYATMMKVQPDSSFSVSIDDLGFGRTPGDGCGFQLPPDARYELDFDPAHLFRSGTTPIVWSTVPNSVSFSAIASDVTTTLTFRGYSEITGESFETTATVHILPVLPWPPSPTPPPRAYRVESVRASAVSHASIGGEATVAIWRDCETCHPEDWTCPIYLDSGELTLHYDSERLINLNGLEDGVGACRKPPLVLRFQGLVVGDTPVRAVYRGSPSCSGGGGHYEMNFTVSILPPLTPSPIPPSPTEPKATPTTPPPSPTESETPSPSISPTPTESPSPTSSEPRRDQLLELLLGTGQSWMDSQSDGVVDAADVVDLAPTPVDSRREHPAFR